MVTSQAQKAVMFSGLTVVGLGALAGMQGKKSYGFKSLIGAGIAFTFLSIGAEFAPNLSGGIAVIAGITVFLDDGADVMIGLLNNASHISPSAANAIKKGALQPPGRGANPAIYDQPIQGPGRVFPNSAKNVPFTQGNFQQIPVPPPLRVILNNPGRHPIGG